MKPSDVAACRTVVALVVVLMTVAAGAVAPVPTATANLIAPLDVLAGLPPHDASVGTMAGEAMAEDSIPAHCRPDVSACSRRSRCRIRVTAALEPQVWGSRSAARRRMVRRCCHDQSVSLDVHFRQKLKKGENHKSAQRANDRDTNMSTHKALAVLVIGVAVAGAWYVRQSWIGPAATQSASGAVAPTPPVSRRSTPASDEIRLPSPSSLGSQSAVAPSLPPGITPVARSQLTLSFESSNNLAQLVRDVSALAAAGDAKAARVVAQALDECAYLSLLPNVGDSFSKPDNGMPTNGREVALAHLARYRERCAELANTEKITPQRLRDAEEAASRGNDLIDQGRRLVEFSSTMSEAEVKSTLRRIVESRDGEAIASMSDAMAQSQDDRELFGPRSGSDTHAVAWKLVACDLGMPCGPESALVRQACVRYGRCIPGDFREIVRYFQLSPWEYELAVKEEHEILQDIANGDFDKIFP